MRVFLLRPAMVFRAMACLAGCLLVAATAVAGIPPDPPMGVPVASAKLANYLQAITVQLGEPAADSLATIDGDGRKLLAARSYLRAGDSLPARWSWSQEQIDAYALTPEYAAAMAEIGKVQAAFAEANPGYELYVNTQVRSVDLQVQRWNSNDSVAVAAIALLAASEAQLDAPGYPVAPARADVARFAGFLVAWQPEPPPNLAAPGLSPHGQSLAYDFQIQKGSDLIAGADSRQIESVWNGQGWTARLAAAVAAGSEHFHGPLAVPDEPWHYQYTP